ncbi:aldo/keto reductase [Candidatus Sumerlaeota bacterium]|nr:aldo/keto reductase [Candidatus Sumerlaeota bacterium]
MHTRKLGNTELELTVIGFGAWAIGGGWKYGWGPQDDDDSIRAIQRAVELGVNWIDTAAVYGLGRSEQVVGRAIKGLRDDLIIATKCSRTWDDAGEIGCCLKAESVLRECEDSLRRLEIDVIDLYQIHWPLDDPHLEEGWEAIQKLIEQGKVRYAGVSNCSPKQMERLRPLGPVASLQPPYSLLERRVEQQHLPYCAEHNIGVVAYSPMRSGLLTGKWTAERTDALAPDDWRRKAKDFNPPMLEKNLEFVERLKAIAEDRGCSVGQLSIAWVLRRPEVTAAIVGARNPRQIEETVPAESITLTGDELARIDQALLIFKE